MAIIAKEINTNLFYYDKVSGKFLGDLSELKGVLGRFYDDACDVGFILVSQVTGKKVNMYLKEQEGTELMHFEGKTNAGLPVYATVFND